MTQHSIWTGPNPAIVIRAGGAVAVRGAAGERVTASTQSKWGLKIEKRSQAEILRARAAVGERVLFDWRLNRPGVRSAAEVIAVQLGASGEVVVPLNSSLKIYAGTDIDVQDIQGRVDAFAGLNLKLERVGSLGNASAGRDMNLNCDTLLGDQVDFKAGGDLRFYVHDLENAYFRIKDLGGYWEAQLGSGTKLISINCGGDVTLVTDQEVRPQPPDYPLGAVERPARA